MGKWNVLRSRALPAVVLTLGAALLVGNADRVASAAPSPSLQGAAELRNCINTSLSGCKSFGQLPERTRVTMVCWEDGSTYTGKYETDRWFYVTGSGKSGFVHASWVIDQTRKRPRCSTQRGVAALRWAAEHVGQTRPSSSDAAGLSIDDGMWSGWCAAFTYGSYKYGAGATPAFAGNAAPRFAEYQRAGKVKPWSSSGDVPVGAMLFWPKVAAPYGHTALYAGNGMAVSTVGLSEPSKPVSRVPVTYWGGSPQGYVAPDDV